MNKSIFTIFLTSLSFLYPKIDAQFIVDDHYLVLHTLTKRDSFSSDVNKYSIISFQNDAWINDEIGYCLLPHPDYLSPKLSAHPSLQEFIANTESLGTFPPILLQTLSYRDTCECLWNETYDKVSQYVIDSTGLNLEGCFEVYITHPSLRNGHSMGQNQIAWGCSGNFPYYDVVYLWHEVLHSYLPNDPISHCVIQLIADNGIRILLNKEEQLFPLIGHPELSALMEAIYPKWEEYLQNSNRNIFELLRNLQSDPLICELAESIY